MVVAVMVGVVMQLIPKPVSASPSQADIIINSTPEGALIIINNSVIGVTPLDCKVTPDVGGTTYTILLQLAGYNDLTTTKTVSPGDSETLTAALTAVGGGRIPINIVWS